MDSFGNNLTEDTKQQTYLTKVVKEYALMMEMQTSKYGIIWSQNVHFVTTLLFPLNKKII